MIEYELILKLLSLCYVTHYSVANVLARWWNMKLTEFLCITSIHFSLLPYEFSSPCCRAESDMQCLVSVKYSLEGQRFRFCLTRPQNLIKPNCCISYPPRANSRWLNFLAPLPSVNCICFHLLMQSFSENNNNS